MWRSCLRLRDGGRRLLNRPRSGLTASEGLGRKPPIPFRAYVPPAERKKFYQNVSISQGEGGFEINLDHRKLRTPQGKLFTVPSEALAIAVATEWDSQQDTIKMYTMHLVTDHTVQHVSGQPHPAGQGPAHPGGREVLGHRHCLVMDVWAAFPRAPASPSGLLLRVVSMEEAVDPVTPQHSTALQTLGERT